VQWCTITNSSEGQTYGFLMAYLPTSHISLHHNLLAHHVERYPEMHWSGAVPPDAGKIDYRNNVCYNPSKYFLYASEEAPAAAVNMNVAGNYFKAGPQTIDLEWFPKMIYLNTKITAYGTDNIMATKEGTENLTNVPLRIPNPVLIAHVMPAVTTYSAKEAYSKVLDKAGAWPRDAMMLRTVEEVRKGTGQHKKDNDVLITGGAQPPADTDMDGMPDKWETAMGLNINSSADNILDQDGDGYTNIEEYINDEALALLGEPILNPKGADGLLRLTPSRVTGSGRLRMQKDMEAGRVVIHLPGLRPEGAVEIADIHGRVVARLPANSKVTWDAANGGQRPVRGVYSVRWIVKGRIAETDALEIL
jgi:hypothetical protein